jgi:hypothetical protein
VVVGLGGTAADREVVRAHDHGAAIDLAPPGEATRGAEPGQLPVRVVLALARETAPLAERAIVEQRGDALAHGELATRTLSLDPLAPAHFRRKLLAPMDFLDLVLPARSAHDRLPWSGGQNCTFRGRMPWLAARAGAT